MLNIRLAVLALLLALLPGCASVISGAGSPLVSGQFRATRWTSSALPRLYYDLKPEGPTLAALATTWVAVSLPVDFAIDILRAPFIWFQERRPERQRELAEIRAQHPGASIYELTEIGMRETTQTDPPFARDPELHFQTRAHAASLDPAWGRGYFSATRRSLGEWSDMNSRDGRWYAAMEQAPPEPGDPYTDAWTYSMRTSWKAVTLPLWLGLDLVMSPVQFVYETFED